MLKERKHKEKDFFWYKETYYPSLPPDESNQYLWSNSISGGSPSLPKLERERVFSEALVLLRSHIDKAYTKAYRKVQVNNVDFQFHIYLNNLAEVITTAKSEILSLEFGWDGDEAEEISQNTFLKVVYLLNNYGHKILEEYEKLIPTPDIQPCPDGTIDIYWENKNGRLLINIKKDGSLASYYGDPYSDVNSIKGIINVFEPQDFLALWIKDFLI